MDRMKGASRALLLFLWVLAVLTAGCSSGAHSTASRREDTSQPIYLAQVSCWDTESCCILRDPLSGLYEPRDERYVAKAKDKESHCGYQQWHRDVDLEVIRWLRVRENATQKEFEAFLREIYNRKDMLERFPHGFGPAT
jgi:hypothetical protein